jgi:hypothetical protein
MCGFASEEDIIYATSLLDQRASSSAPTRFR